MNSYFDTKKIKEIVIYTFIFGIIAHGFFYFNADFTHDSLYGIVGISAIDEMNISIGRFLLPLYLKVRGYVASPALIGFIGLLFVGLSSYMIIDLLKIKNNVLVIITSAILVTNYSITVTNATYINDSDPYYISLFFAVLTVFILKKFKGFYKVFSIASIVISIGLYQAYFQVAIFLLMILAILQIMNLEETKDIIKENLINLGYIFVGVIVYYILYKLIVIITNVETWTGYNAIPELSYYFNFEKIIIMFRYMLDIEKQWFIGKNNHHAQVVHIINILFMFIILFTIAYKTIKNKLPIKSIVLEAIILLLMPIGMNIIGFLCDLYEHEVMTYSFFLFYAFAIVMIEMLVDDIKLNKYIRYSINGVSCICLLFLILSNCIYSNEMYLEKNLIVKSTQSLMTRVIDRMEQTEGYKLGETPVVFIGSPVQTKYNYYRTGFLNTAEATNVYNAITYYQTYESYFNEYLGYPVNLLDIVAEYNYAELPEVKAMPCFPEKGSVAFVGDTLVVKFAWDEE